MKLFSDDGGASAAAGLRRGCAGSGGALTLESPAVELSGAALYTAVGKRA
jgi:hypothetical protein